MTHRLYFVQHPSQARCRLVDYLDVPLPREKVMPLAPRSVLIADDERDIATLLARILTPLGLTPIVVYSGSNAINAAQTHAHELCLAILDIQMPGINGVDAAIAIYKLVPHVPIVLMSGGISQNLATRIAQVPLAGVLAKPFTIQQVHMLLRQLGLIP